MITSSLVNERLRERRTGRVVRVKFHTNDGRVVVADQDTGEREYLTREDVKAAWAPVHVPTVNRKDPS